MSNDYPIVAIGINKNGSDFFLDCYKRIQDMVNVYDEDQLVTYHLHLFYYKKNNPVKNKRNWYQRNSFDFLQSTDAIPCLVKLIVGS